MNFRELLLREMDTPDRTDQLAERLGVPKAELEQYAKETKAIPLSTACQICEAMGVQTVQDIDVDVNIDWLLHRNGLWDAVKEDRWQRWLRTEGDRQRQRHWDHYEKSQWPVMLGEGSHESEYEDWCRSELDDVRGQWEARRKESWEPAAFAEWEEEELQRLRSHVEIINAPDWFVS
jgi:hypothetical protein